MNSRSRRCAEVRIDVAGRLVGEQELRPRDHGARDRGALLLAARKHRRQRPHALAEPDPVQQLDHLVAVARPRPCRARAAAARRSRRWSDDRAGGNPGTRCRCGAAASPAHPCSSVATSWSNSVIRPRVGSQRQEQQAQQRGLAGARRAGQELERVRLDAEGEVAQRLPDPSRSAGPHSRIGPQPPSETSLPCPLICAAEGTLRP